MALNSAAHTAAEDDITKRCHVNSNEEGDCFVGIKADSDNAMAYFPIAYRLPETDAEIRRDIKHLIRVLSEFTSKENRLLAVNKFTTPQKVDFPINAYMEVIEYYLSAGGKYYVETDPTGLVKNAAEQSAFDTAKRRSQLFHIHRVYSKSRRPELPKTNNTNQSFLHI